MISIYESISDPDKTDELSCCSNRSTSLSLSWPISLSSPLDPFPVFSLATGRSHLWEPIGARALASGSSGLSCNPQAWTSQTVEEPALQFVNIQSFLWWPFAKIFWPILAIDSLLEWAYRFSVRVTCLFLPTPCQIVVLTTWVRLVLFIIFYFVFTLMCVLYVLDLWTN